MFKRRWLVAVPFVAGAIIALTPDSAWAWTQQTVAPNGNYNFNYGPLDDKSKSGNSANKSDPNSPGFHFGVQNGQSSGFHSSGSSGSANAPPSQPYFRTFGN
jgi:hypothetical protein